MTTTTARELMTRDVLTAREEMPVGELAALLAVHGITGAAVNNDQGRLVGVASLADIAPHAGERAHIVRDEPDPEIYVRGAEEISDREDVAGLGIEHPALMVRDVMNPAVHTVPEDTELSEVAEKMLRGRLHRILVSRGDQLVGIISMSDFLRLFIDCSASAADLAGEAQQPEDSSFERATMPCRSA